MKNIGWLYNKSYFEQLCYHEQNVAGDILLMQNAFFEEVAVDNAGNSILDNEREVLCSKEDSPYFQISLKTGYPGLVTGIGINHQTTKVWSSSNKEKVSEFKLGLEFDHATGLPIILGSSIKGALRSAFPIANQHGFCEEYDAKARYIATIVQWIVNLSDFIDGKDEFIKSKLVELEWDTYKMQNDLDSEQSKESYCAALSKQYASEINAKEEELLEKLGNGEISEDELYNQLENFIPSVLEEKIDGFYNLNRTNRKLRESFVKKASVQFEKALEAICEANFDEIDDVWIQKAPEIANEIFEGKKFMGGVERNIEPYKRDVFFDAFPKCDGKRLFAADNITPHPSPFADPVPISFLKIRPDVEFRFFFSLHDGILTRRQKLLLFYKILCDRGIGAKTNLGYGRFSTSFSKISMILQ